MTQTTVHTNDPRSVDSSIPDYAAAKARTLRFSCGAPRSPRLLGDGSRMLFLRSDGAEDTATSLWMGEADGTETLLADPRALLTDADAEDVPAAERARRERAREGGSGIVSYAVDAAGRVVVFTINDQLFVSTIADDVAEAETTALDVHAADGTGEPLHPILNPRVSPDGTRIAYSTGAAVIVVDAATGEAGVAYAVPQDERADVRAGIAEFAAAEEMDRY
ncbi:MAG: peptidase, partial [Bifidobacterium choerinum]